MMIQYKLVSHIKLCFCKKEKQLYLCFGEIKVKEKDCVCMDENQAKTNDVQATLVFTT